MLSKIAGTGNTSWGPPRRIIFKHKRSCHFENPANLCGEMLQRAYWLTGTLKPFMATEQLFMSLNSCCHCTLVQTLLQQFVIHKLSSSCASQGINVSKMKAKRVVHKLAEQERCQPPPGSDSPAECPRQQTGQQCY